MSMGSETPTTSNVLAQIAPQQTTELTQTGVHAVTVPPNTTTLYLTGSNTCLFKTVIGNI